MKNDISSSANFILPFLISIICLMSCQKNDNECMEPITNPMNLENLEIGDRFLFSFLIGDSYHDDENFDFNYTADTLELLVTDYIDGKYIIQERILPTSMIFQTNENYLRKDSIYLNNWHIENDSLKISSDVVESPGSHLLNFYFSNEFGFPLNDFVDEEVEMIGWKTENSYVGYSHDFYTTNFMLLGNTYNRLNVMIRNIGMAVDADGWTYVYSKENGFARVITYSAWTTTGSGWDKI